jgi:predicted nucleic acid-binding protein
MDAEWIAPPLWRSELRNLLNQARRASRLDLPAVLALLSLADEVMRRADVQPDARRVMQLTEPSGCTTHDCEFVEVAERRHAPLYKADARILKAFPEIARRLPTS